MNKATNIRTLRGRWCPLSPCFPWTVETEYKKYPSMINFLYDDTISPPAKLLNPSKISLEQDTHNHHKQHPAITKEKIVQGIKFLLKTWPQYKLYLQSSPDDLQFINPYTNWTNIYNQVLQDAKKALKKYKIKGQEVVEKRAKFEKMGAVIIGDEATFEYNAKDDVDKVVYGISSDLEIERLNSIGKMISSYISLFDKIPEFLLTPRDENPSLYYILIKTQPEQIAKILCSVNVKNLQPSDPKKKEELLEKINENIGYLWPYIVLPSELHPSIKKEFGIKDILKIINYHSEYDTLFKKEIETRLQMLEYSFTPREVDILNNEINNNEGTESDDSSLSIETLEFEEIDEVEDLDFTTDKWIIHGDDGRSSPSLPPDLPPDPQQQVVVDLPKTTIEEPPIVMMTPPLPVFNNPQPPINNNSQSVPLQQTYNPPSQVVPLQQTYNPPSQVVPAYAQPSAESIQQAQQEVMDLINTPGMEISSKASSRKNKTNVSFAIPTPQVPQVISQPQQPPLQQVYHLPPPIPPPLQTPPIPQPLPPQPQLPWEKRFQKINQLGHVVEPMNPLSPFGKNPVLWKGEKYENMLAVLYNEAILAIIGPQGTGAPASTFKNSANKAKAHLQAYNKTENVIIWFKDRGVEILREMVNSDLYKQRKQQMSMSNVGQLTFLFSRRKQDSYLLEPWVGTIKVENGIPFHGLFIGGWNIAWSLQV
uniref:Uncharacterized protein n=1 Tax=viral metagenome TaxID=1070528 RepID=A0A6C0JTH5_9ZZZZ